MIVYINTYIIPVLVYHLPNYGLYVVEMVS